MHETGIVKALIHEVERVARHYGAPKVKSVRVRLGALSPFSDSHLRDHFVQEGEGTIVQGAVLVIDHSTDPADPLAQDVVLLSIEIEDTLPMTVRSARVDMIH